ncbi:MAG: NAD(P)-dependent oxidoreductase [Planctomycetota bacterium]|jgi:nucleoside-diphosphate-sugar epimerase|nr:NAD(P)-dependent oxidoreductase [Planctomycetota bacterium]MDP7130639.1 NAD(P)-dependent oxidoreductase [Planctomycetota bacterium]MDP7250917.1 NAD(P)-dependent oxidoreductase [Planctomycetota bacterium]
MSNPLTVLVTGSAGRIGSATCVELIARGHSVRGFDIRESTGEEKFYIGDLTDRAAIDEAMVGVDAVVHLAATPDEGDFMTKLLPNNIIGLYNILESAREAGVKRAVLASTCQVISGHEGPWPVTSITPISPRNWYASTKVFAEAVGQMYAYRHGISVIVVRPAWCPRHQGQVDSISANKSAQDGYFSPGDAGRFFACAAEADLSIKYSLLHGTSKAVVEQRVDFSEATRAIGYEPQHTWPEGVEVAGVLKDS